MSLATVLKRSSDERGAVLVEFALVLPLLLILVFGMLEFGKAFNYWIDTTHLANEAARWAVVNNNPGAGTLQEYIKSQATVGRPRSHPGTRPRCASRSRTGPTTLAIPCTSP